MSLAEQLVAPLALRRAQVDQEQAVVARIEAEFALDRQPRVTLAAHREGLHTPSGVEHLVDDQRGQPVHAHPAAVARDAALAFDGDGAEMAHVALAGSGGGHHGPRDGCDGTQTSTCRST
jgi:hypothetical protein